MSEKFPDEIDVQSHKYIISMMDFIVVNGVIYQVIQSDFYGLHLMKVDEIPEEYYE